MYILMYTGLYLTMDILVYTVRAQASMASISS
jgi:hypothetical protein